MSAIYYPKLIHVRRAMRCMSKAKASLVCSGEDPMNIIFKIQGAIDSTRSLHNDLLTKAQEAGEPNIEALNYIMPMRDLQGDGDNE